MAEKILFGTVQLTWRDNKITLVNITFNLNACKNLSKKELDNLSDIARNFFYFIRSFGNKLKLGDFVNILMIEAKIQDLDSVTCGIFQIYFYDNLLNPDQNSKIQNKTNLNKKTKETLLNELFVLNDQEQKETTINKYATVTSQSHDLPVPEPTMTYLLGIVNFGRVRKNDKVLKT